MPTALKVAFGVIHVAHFQFKQRSRNGLQKGDPDDKKAKSSSAFPSLRTRSSGRKISLVSPFRNGSSRQSRRSNLKSTTGGSPSTSSTIARSLRDSLLKP